MPKFRPGKTFTNTLWSTAFVLLFCHFQAAAQIPERYFKCQSMLKTLATGQTPKNPSTVISNIKQVEKEIQGLNFDSVIAWKPNEIIELNRKLVRYHDVDEFAHPIPLFDKAQKLGPATVKFEDIRFSQLGAQNASEGGYTVISNAHALKNGTLKTTDLPKLRVWRDVDGNIWTLDHRRLAAMRLSGSVDKLVVEFVPEEMVKTQRFKFDTQTRGESIMVRVEKPGEEPLAIVLMNESLKKEVASTALARKTTEVKKKAIPLEQINPSAEKVFETVILRFPEAERKRWLAERGDDYIQRLKDYSKDLANSYRALENRTSGDYKDLYQNLGIVSVRGKAENSIIMKLARKDFDAFMNNQQGISNLKQAVAAIGDGIGARVTLNINKMGKTIDEASIQAFVDQVVLDIKNGTRVTEIMNYRPLAEQAKPYLSDAQIEQIVRADQEYRLGLQKLKDSGKEVKIPEPMIVKNGKAAGFETGYSSFHMNIQYPSSIQAEFQLRGALVNEASEIQHFFYDLKSGKVLSENHQKNAEIAKAAETFKQLSPDDKKNVMKYVEQEMVYARRLEAGEVTGPPPILPAGIPTSLTFENLKPHLIHD